MTFYSREITMPTTKREGLENFIQMIINQIEAGNSQEALLKAVDLLQDVSTGVYDDAMTDANGIDHLVRELDAKHQADVIAAGQYGHDRGVAEEKTRMAKALGLAA